MTADRPGGWRVVRSGPPDRTILAIDFGPRPNEPTFAHLAANLAGEATVLQAVPPQLVRFVAAPAEYAASWLADPMARRPVLAVLAFCAGAAYASVLAQALAPAGDRRLFLFDPVRVDRALLLQEFDDARAPFAGAGAVVDSGAGDLLEFGATLATAYAATLRAAFPPSAGRAADDLAAWFRGYLQFLVAAAGAAPVGGGASCYAVLSREHGAAVPGAARTFRSDQPRARLLADPAAAAFVDAHL